MYSKSLNHDDLLCVDIADIMGEQMDTVIGQIDVDLEGRFAKVRTEETNLGKTIFDFPFCYITF